MKWSRRDWIVLLAVTALGAILRFYKLGSVPPGFQFDEAFNAMDAAQVLFGNHPLFLPANAGREVVYTYWQAALAALFGLNVYSLRLASAIAGVTAIPVTYLFLRRLFSADGRKVALFTSLTLAVSFWHIHFSHYGIRVIMMPVIFSGVFGFAWLGHHASTRRMRLVAYVVSGVLTGLSAWTHPTGRLAPIVLIAFTLWLLWREPDARRIRWDSPLAGLVWSGAAALIVFLPLGLDFYHHPDFFFGHASEVSIFAGRVGGNAPLLALAQNVLKVLGMFSFAGDREWTHDLAGRPVFDPLLAAVFYIGLAVGAYRLLRQRHIKQSAAEADALALMAAWAIVMLFPSILSEAAPNFSRTLPALPALFVPAGLGLTWLTEWRKPPAWLRNVLVAAVLVYSGGRAAYDYFVNFAHSEAVYYAFDADKIDALNYLKQFTGNHQVYLSQLWGDKHATVYFLRGNFGIKSADIGDTIVLPPPGQGAVYAFPAEQAKRAEQVAALWPGLTTQSVPDRYGRTLLVNVTLDSDTASHWPPKLEPTAERPARFIQAPTLMGLQAATPDKQVTLFWGAETPMTRNLTSFVHLIDTDGHRVGQIDKLPGNGSYPTTDWTPGERVIDRYFPAIMDRCAGGEDVRVQVGWYELKSGDQPRPRADSSGDSALAGHLILPVISYPPDELQPSVRMTSPVSPTLTLLGYTLHGDRFQAGSPLTIDLFWLSRHAKDEKAPSGQPIVLTLSGAARDQILWQGDISDHAHWSNNEAICRRIALRLPTDLASGNHDLRLALPSPAAAKGGTNTIVSLTQLTIEKSTRQFDLPPLIQKSGALLSEPNNQDGQIRLAGIAALTSTVSSSQPAAPSALSVTLVWQALGPVRGNYKAFVHLLDDDGKIVAQSDAIPANGYAANRWVTGEVVSDTHTLVLPADVASGTYHLNAGLYDPVSGQRLLARSTTDQPFSDNAVPLGTIRWPLP